MDRVLNRMRAQQDEMVALLRQMVEIESPSTDKQAVDRLGTFVAGHLRELVSELARAVGGSVKVHRSRTTGDHLQAEFFGSPSGRPTGRSRANKNILLLGHMDTVWDMGTLSVMPFRVARGKAYGPGVYDMKSGIVVALFALRHLIETGVPMPRPVTWLLNADEEIGSPSSRSLTEATARRSIAALVLEPSYGAKGALKTSRKGTGEYRIHVQGRAAHAGLDPEKGASAINELSRQLIFLQHIADTKRGITLNPGVIVGGTRTNVVAATAEASIDVRIRHLADGPRVDKLLRGLRPHDRRTRLRITGGMNRPPFEVTPEGAELFNRARDLARPLGISLEQAAVGGGSDGNFTAALGVPTLDGLGGVGDGAHASHEHIVISELPRRAALLAHLLANLASED